MSLKGELVVPDPAAIAPIQGPIKALLAQSQCLVIRSEVDLDLAGGLLQEIKARYNEAEGLRKSLSAPINLHLKKLNAMFKSLTDPLSAAETRLKQQIVDYRARQQAIAADQAERVRQEQARLAMADASRRAAAADSEDEARAIRAEAVDQVKAIQTADAYVAPPARAAGVSVRTLWDWELVDIGQVPTEFLAVDGAAIRKAIAAGVREIPGVRVFQRESVAVR